MCVCMNPCIHACLHAHCCAAFPVQRRFSICLPNVWMFPAAATTTSTPGLVVRCFYLLVLLLLPSVLSFIAVRPLAARREHKRSAHSSRLVGKRALHFSNMCESCRRDFAEVHPQASSPLCARLPCIVLRASHRIDNEIFCKPGQPGCMTDHIDTSV